ncbi:protein POLR1D isoform X1 [Accipiter gentilis]|uniref:protein POLR1D isoform X1 n=1 Tax=Astur gentilis TaxID=8957 RepID=UPI00210F6C06|nr:protein POLR1D isoform X1 [Accipiter gentilis]
MEEDPELERKAVEELLKEAKRGRTRAETMGAMGCPLSEESWRRDAQTLETSSVRPSVLHWHWIVEATRPMKKRFVLPSVFGLKCPLAGTNKRFLINTIKNTLPSQKEQDQEREQKEDSKEPEPNKSRKEEKPKKCRIHPYTPSFQSRRRVSCSPPRHRNRNQHTKDKHEKRSSKR